VAVDDDPLQTFRHRQLGVEARPAFIVSIFQVRENYRRDLVNVEES
jgi:hypothetical protein